MSSSHKFTPSIVLMGLAIAAAFGSQETAIEGRLTIFQDHFVVILDSPVSSASDSYQEPVTSNRVVIAAQTEEQAREIRSLVGWRVRAMGVLSAAVTRTHSEPLVMEISDIPRRIDVGNVVVEPTRAFTPPPGSLLRKALMDTLRAEFYYKTREEAERNPQKIVFKVHYLKVNGDWALAKVIPMQDGTELLDIHWNLLHRNSQGEWRVVDHYEPLRKYFVDDADFFSALDLDARAVRYLKKEMPQIPEDIFPH